MRIQLLGLLLVYLAIATNFLKPTLGCYLQHTLQDSALLRHLTVFAIIMLSSVYQRAGIKDPKEILRQGIVIYALFFVSSYLSPTFFIILFLIVATFLIYTRLYDEKDEMVYDYNKTDPVNLTTTIALTLTIILGLLDNLGIHKIEYGKKFNFWKYLHYHCKRGGKMKGASMSRWTTIMAAFNNSR